MAALQTQLILDVPHTQLLGREREGEREGGNNPIASHRAFVEMVVEVYGADVVIKGHSSK